MQENYLNPMRNKDNLQTHLLYDVLCSEMELALLHHLVEIWVSFPVMDAH